MPRIGTVINLGDFSRHLILTSFVGISSLFKIKVYKITFYLYISKIKSKFPIYSEKLKVNENYISSLSLIFCVSLYLSNSTSTVFGGSDMLHVER